MPYLPEIDVAAWPGSALAGSRKRLACGEGLVLEQVGPGGAKTWIVHITTALNRDREMRIGTYPHLAYHAAQQRAALLQAQELSAAAQALAMASAAEGAASDALAALADAAIATLEDIERPPRGRSSFGAVAIDGLRALQRSAMAKQRGDALVQLQATAAILERHLRHAPLWRTAVELVRAPLIRGAVQRCWALDGEAAAQRLQREIHAVLLAAATNAPGIHELATRWRDSALPPLSGLPRIGQQLRSIDHASGSRQIKQALHALAWLLQPPKVVRPMQWTDLDLDNARWYAPNKRRYGCFGLDYLPLPSQMVALLRSLERRSLFVFYSPVRNDIPVWHSAMQQFLRRNMDLRFPESPGNARPAFADWVVARLAGDSGSWRNAIAFILDQRVTAARGLPLNAEPVRALLQDWADAVQKAQQEAALQLTTPTLKP